MYLGEPRRSSTKISPKLTCAPRSSRRCSYHLTRHMRVFLRTLRRPLIAMPRGIESMAFTACHCDTTPNDASSLLLARNAHTKRLCLGFILLIIVSPWARVIRPCDEKLRHVPTCDRSDPTAIIRRQANYFFFSFQNVHLLF